MARGGARPVPARSGPSGPGKYSKRSDAQQIEAGSLGGGPRGESSLQYGDVSALENAQRVAPLPSGVAPPSPGAAPMVGAETGGGQGGIPPYLLDMPTSRVGEPVTTGLDVGAGPGSEALAQPAPMDPREATLIMLQQQFGNEAAGALLERIRRERMAAQVPMQGMSQAPGPAPPQGAGPTDLADTWSPS